ncbi:MAG: glycosyltransferase [Sphingobacteriales bacterium]|nr:glycosyltransferase [Sphingobacteriales bacterium]MBI3718021.1 glycosyltransferase [Sphingobacteriales bacterium]
MKPAVTIFYDYFSPAYKAGGPIRSLQNLVRLLGEQYQFSIITGAFDKGDDRVLPGICLNVWNDKENGTKVFYWSGGLTRLLHVLKQCAGSAIYINGIYSPWFNILPLILYKNKIILAPRGMLHEGALNQKSLKKKVYLFFFKLLGWHRKVVFHATDEKEMEFIRRQFGNNVKVFVAPNVPENMGMLPVLSKKPGNLNLVSVALVGPMKNYHLVLSALKNVKENVTYNIYGPVISREYWNECLKIINELPENIQVNYHGELLPEKVKEVLEENHIFILPSVSENFGHALFESFSAGKPVITSNNTPWKNLQNFKAGWNAETSTDALARIINEACDLKSSDYEVLCKGAKAIADNYFSRVNFSEAYKQLFT